MDELNNRKEIGQHRYDVSPRGKGRINRGWCGLKRDRRHDHCSRRSLVRTLLSRALIAAPSDIPDATPTTLWA